jgi:hypothetical protein
MMFNVKLSSIALGLVLLAGPTSAFDAPAAQLISQLRSGTWTAIPRATIPQGSYRTVRAFGPWMDHVVSVTTVNGVTGQNVVKDGDRTVKMILTASASSTRGDSYVLLNISCSDIDVMMGCTRGPVRLPTKILETGPINHIYPNGTVPANSTVTFDLLGEGLDVAVLLTRLLTLSNASILSQSAGTIRVKGTTPSCGHIDVALSDKADGSEAPYRKGASLESVVSGRLCSGSLAPALNTYIECGPGKTWDPNLKICKV